MTLPGTSVLSRTGSSRQSLPIATGTCFIMGTAERGPTDKPYAIHSMAEFTALYGVRSSLYDLYDNVDALLRIGVSTVYVLRLVGPSAAYDQVTAVDRAGTPLATMVVRTAGQNASNLTYAISNGVGANTFVVTVADSTAPTVILDQSPDLGSPSAAVEWASNSKWIRITDSGSATVAPNNNPAVIAATALNGGADDIANIIDSARVTALNKFTLDLGSGQVVIPGVTTATVHTAILAHAKANRRTGLCDGPNTGTAATAISAAAAQRTAGAEVTRGAMFGGAWVKLPGLFPNSSRTFAPSVIAAGLMALSDQTNSPNVAAAGENGICNIAIDVTQTFNDADRELLNNAGVNLFRNFFGVRLYGFRTLADPAGPDADWINLANQRLRMQIEAQASAISEKYVFAEIDGGRRKLSEFAGLLSGMLKRMYTDGAIFGDTPDHAYSVNVGPQVNTVATLSAQELHAEMSVKMSPMAERVIIGFSKTAISQTDL